MPGRDPQDVIPFFSQKLLNTHGRPSSSAFYVPSPENRPAGNPRRLFRGNNQTYRQEQVRAAQAPWGYGQQTPAWMPLGGAMPQSRSTEQGRHSVQ